MWCTSESPQWCGAAKQWQVRELLTVPCIVVSVGPTRGRQSDQNHKADQTNLQQRKKVFRLGSVQSTKTPENSNRYHSDYFDEQAHQQQHGRLVLQPTLLNLKTVPHAPNRTVRNSVGRTSRSSIRGSLGVLDHFGDELCKGSATCDMKKHRE